MAKKIINEEAAAEVPAASSEGCKVPPDTSETGSTAKKILSDTSETSSTAKKILSDTSETSSTGKKILSDGSEARSEGVEVLPDGSDTASTGKKVLSDTSETIPDHADRILRTLTGYAELYIDPQGGTFTVDSPPALRAAATRYTNPHYKRP